MMIEPPIESLLKKTDGNHYKLCVLASKRAKEISNKNYFNEVQITDYSKKEITQALEEINEGVVVAGKFGEE